MHIWYAATCLLAGLSAVAAAAGAETPEPLVKGRTTVAEVEQGLGAPMDTSMAANGALRLVYPYDRLAARFPVATGTVTKPHLVELRFSADFTYEQAVLRTTARAAR